MGEIINNTSDYDDFEKDKAETAKRHLLKEVKEAVKFAGNYHDFALSLDVIGVDVHLIGVHPDNNDSFDISVEDIEAKTFKLVVKLEEGEVLEGVEASIGRQSIEYNNLDFTTLGRILNNRVIVELLI